MPCWKFDTVCTNRRNVSSLLSFLVQHLILGYINIANRQTMYVQKNRFRLISHVEKQVFLR